MVQRQGRCLVRFRVHGMIMGVYFVDIVNLSLCSLRFFLFAVGVFWKGVFFPKRKLESKFVLLFFWKETSCVCLRLQAQWTVFGHGILFHGRIMSPTQSSLSGGSKYTRERISDV